MRGFSYSTFTPSCEFMNNFRYLRTNFETKVFAISHDWALGCKNRRTSVPGWWARFYKSYRDRFQYACSFLCVV